MVLRKAVAENDDHTYVPQQAFANRIVLANAFVQLAAVAKSLLPATVAEQIHEKYGVPPAQLLAVLAPDCSGDDLS
ncbi:hypothetical protein JOF56_011004 [Kibdelosporangium banguiense]|uniref:Uncharacterized protein n=1 Tax=Kibdelosporangium banguiense TaxID=1365924 RepID=A0ABS4U1U1_9PSEU|nr:hypothetical protein [Kibdelosporangium banguiense]MBP2330619.1 hypothetical protein [Kibdelosporangium banguiense]